MQAMRQTMKQMKVSLKLLAVPLLLTLLALLVPLFPSVLYPVFVMKVMCYALFALAFNLLIGYTGLVSFGHAAFLGAAGYVTGALMLRFAASGLPVEIALLAGVLTAAGLGYLMGMLAIRRLGIYFARVTLALSHGAYV